MPKCGGRNRERAIAIGEKPGWYNDWPASDLCIPPWPRGAIEAPVKKPG